MGQTAPPRRSEYEVVINPDVRTHVRKRLAVTVIFAPDVGSATQRLLEEINK